MIILGGEFEVLGEERIIAMYTTYTLPNERNDTKYYVTWPHPLGPKLAPLVQPPLGPRTGPRAGGRPPTVPLGPRTEGVLGPGVGTVG